MNPQKWAVFILNFLIDWEPHTAAPNKKKLDRAPQFAVDKQQKNKGKRTLHFNDAGKNV